MGFEGAHGSGRLECPLCTQDTDAGPGAAFRFGAGVSQRLLLGLEARGWWVGSGTFADGAEPGGMDAGFLTAQFYPRGDGGVFARAGVGVVSSLYWPTSTYTSPDRLTSRGALLALGYDWRLGARFALVPSATWMGAVADGTLNHAATNPMSATARPSVVFIGAALEWYGLWHQ